MRVGKCEKCETLAAVQLLVVKDGIELAMDGTSAAARSSDGGQIVRQVKLLILPHGHIEPYV